MEFEKLAIISAVILGVVLLMGLFPTVAVAVTAISLVVLFLLDKN